jgi:hypothetical protein
MFSSLKCEEVKRLRIIPPLLLLLYEGESVNMSQIEAKHI